jgi:hypothetical protein
VRRPSILAFLISTLCTSAAAQTPLPPPFVWGVGTHLVGAENNLQKLDHLHDLGFTAFRDDVHWHVVEKRHSVYEVPAAWDAFVSAAASKGIRPLLVLLYGNPLYEGGKRPKSAASIAAFARYAGFVAEHFKPLHPIYEVWNEWKMERSSDVQEYIAVVSATSQAVRKSDPTATVIAGGFNVRGLKALGTFVSMDGMKYIDGLSIHPYVQCEWSSGPDGYSDLISAMAKLVHLKPNQSLYVTEIGWPTHKGRCGVSEARAAQYLAESYLIAKCKRDVAGIWWYDLRNDGPNLTDPELNFGLFSFDYKPKGSVAIARRIGSLNSSISCARYSDSPQREGLYELNGKSLSYQDMLRNLLRGSRP